MTKRRDDFFRELAIGTPQALWVCDANMIHYVNPGWRRLTGRQLSPGDAAAKLFDAIHPGDRQKLVTDFNRHPRGGADVECRILRPDGTISGVCLQTFPIDGGLVAGSMQDVTARQSENQRNEQRMNDFVSTVSHELRTPLTSISGSLGLLASNASWKLPAGAERLLFIAYANSKRLVRLVNDILDIEKIESGGMVFVLKRAMLGALIEQAIELNRGFAETYDVRIRLEGAEIDCEVEVDLDRFVQVMTNLLSNAVKFSPPGGSVAVAIERDAAQVRIAVRDHGAGIPDAFKPRVFEKFARAESTEPRHKSGTGLGLSIAKQIVVQLGGTLSFADAPGGGAVFWIALPAYACSPEPAIGAEGANKKEVA